MAFTFSDSFGGVSFRILARDATVEQDARVTVRHIPGGNNVYVDFAGLPPGRRRYLIHLQSDADFNTLRTKVGTQGTLVDSVRGNATVLLMPPLVEEERTPDGQIFARAEFLLL